MQVSVFIVRCGGHSEKSLSPTSQTFKLQKKRVVGRYWYVHKLLKDFDSFFFSGWVVIGTDVLSLGMSKTFANVGS